MRKMYLASLFVLATTSAFAAGADGVTGMWKIHSNIAGTESDQDCTLAVDKGTLSGTCKSDSGEVKLTGSVDAKKVTWKYDSDYQGTPLKITYTGTLDDAGSIKGDVDVQPFAVTGDFTATPAKTDAAPKK